MNSPHLSDYQKSAQASSVVEVGNRSVRRRDNGSGAITQVKPPYLLTIFLHIQSALDFTCCEAPSLTIDGVMGIAPSAYKNLCSNGLVWVEWRKICIRA